MMRVGAARAGAGAVTAQHLRGGPAVQLHQVSLGPAAVQPGVAEMMPEPVRPGIHPGLPTAAGDHLVDPVRGHRPAVAHPQPQLRPPRLRMPGPDPQVPVQGTGSLVPDPDHPRPAALAAHGDLPPPQVDIAAPRVTRVIPDPGQLPRPDPGRREHRDDRRVTPLGERAALAGLLQGRKFFAGEDRHQLLAHLRGAQRGHRVRDLLLLGQPAEELLQRPELVTGVRVAVPGQQVH